MSRRIVWVLSLVVLSLLVAAPALANPGQPSFAGNVWGDGRLWGTKGAATLPAPSGSNLQSFEKLFEFTNNPNQLPVAEAAPGNPAYNGGRWYTQTATWTAAGIAAYGGSVPVLMSYSDILANQSMGYLTVTAGSPPGGPAPFFECPLLPVK